MVVRKKTLGKRRTLRKRRTLGKRKRRSCRNMKAGVSPPAEACGRIQLRENLDSKKYEFDYTDHPMKRLLEALNLSFDEDTALVQDSNPIACQNIKNAANNDLETWFRTYDPLVQDGRFLVRKHTKDRIEVSRDGIESADEIATKYQVKNNRVLEL